MSAPDVKTDYYSGQGRILMGKRDPLTGRIYDVLKIGNCSALQISLTVDKTDHTESWSGGRNIDLTTFKSKGGTGKMSCEDIDVDTLAAALWGGAYIVPEGTVDAEPMQAVRGGVLFTKFQNISAVEIKLAAAPATPLVEGVDFTYDGAFGRIDFLDTDAATVLVATAVDDATSVAVTVDYTYGATKRLELFTVAVAPERYIRFEGLNTINGDSRLVEVWRGQLDPLNQLDLINTDVASTDISFTVAQASGPFEDGKSRFYRETRVEIEAA
jgi:hypothetical protein